MPLPGGPSAKSGYSYETWWTVHQLVRIIDGQAKSIRLEDPKVDKAEFVVTTETHQEHHQTKRSHQTGKWSLFSLAGDDLLQTMYDQLSRNSAIKFVFVSGSDAPELRELTERAVSAGSLEEFEAVFINTNSHKQNFTNLKQHWCNTTTAKAYKILQRIEVRTIDESTLAEQVREQLRARFLTEPEAVYDALRSIVQDSVHRFIDRKSLIVELENRGFKLRQLVNPTDAHSLISNVTNNYLEAARRKLIQRTLIPRPPTQELLDKIRGNATDGMGTDCVLTGKAGGGKTATVIECVEKLLQSGNFSVLAFRLDRMDPVSSTKKLGESLGLEESPAFVVKTAAEVISSEAILVIDQLDAISTTSGRNSDFLDVVEKLLIEARGFRNKVILHIVVVCREFDWKNDHRLCGLVNENHENIAITDFSPEQVTSVLAESGFNIKFFDKRQRKLLRLPQNLEFFLAAQYNHDSRQTFSSPKDLFDQYWAVKRRMVNRRTTPAPDQWNDVIQTLCKRMTASQQLSVSKEKLDSFSPDYLDQMASEGVLVFAENRYSFGHESFFDYCFARTFITKNESLTEFLVAAEQHLFRRAQVRQVLAYLRDADRGRYCRELKELLTDRRIRGHLKDLAAALAVSLPDPEENEWDVLESYIRSELDALVSGNPNPDKLSTMVWNHFFGSQSWFGIVDAKYLIADWLTSENDNLANMGIRYIRIHQRHSGDRAAELLEPFVGQGGNWPQRFRDIMRWSDYTDSRGLFDLFLRLMDDGTLDDEHDSPATSTVSSTLYELQRNHPDWIPEVLAHWLQRRFSIIRETRDSEGHPHWYELFDHNTFLERIDLISKSATRFPDEFVQHVLPVVLEITDTAVYEQETALPKPDGVWHYLLSGKPVSSCDACWKALTIAVEKLAETESDNIAEILEELRRRDTLMANHLLLRAYTAGARQLADAAVSELCDNPWRFQCGYTDSPYWIAMQLIKAVTPLCSDQSRARLEEAILNYTPEYERARDCLKSNTSTNLTPGEYKLAGNFLKSGGRASFALLSGIPVELRSRNVQSRYMELERKFGAVNLPPRTDQIYPTLVISPIEKPSTEKITDDQWLKAIRQYGSERPDDFDWANPGKGGARELARVLQELMEKQPERFARLSLRFPSGTNPYYMEHVLGGLKEAAISTELKLAVCLKAYSETRENCGKAITDVLGSIEGPLPDGAIKMLDWLATRHPDPKTETRNEQGIADSIMTHGINTTRGRASTLR